MPAPTIVRPSFHDQSPPTRPQADVRHWAGIGAVTAAALLWGTIGLANSFRPMGVELLAVASARVVLGGGLLLAWAAMRGQAEPFFASF